MNVRVLCIFTVTLFTVAITNGCDKFTKDESKVATQVAAKVNADEITVHQVNNVLTQRNDIDAKLAPPLKRAALETLINQQLARQKAIEAQLDRSPDVVQAIEAAKTQILARAHLNGINRTLVKPTPLEIEKYYSNHPELFAQRRIFSLENISFTGNAEIAAGLRGQMSKGRSMKEIAEWLQSKGVKFAANRGARAAEQIPLVLLPKLQAMKKGEIQLFEAPGGRYEILRVADYLDAPMDQATAAPRIERFLFNQTASQAIAREMNEIRKQAKIEYVGEFAERAAPAEAKGRGEPDARSFTEAEAKAAAEAQAKSQGPATGQGQK